MLGSFGAPAQWDGSHTVSVFIETALHSIETCVFILNLFDHQKPFDQAMAFIFSHCSCLQCLTVAVYGPHLR